MGSFQMTTYELLSKESETTVEIGRTIGRWCKGEDLLLLHGPFGAGKTVLTQGIAEALGITGPIRSPSFTLMSTYKADLTLAHWDLFRLSSIHEVWDLGILDQIDEKTICVIEWAEKGSELFPETALDIDMDYTEDYEDRIIRIEIDTSNPRHLELSEILNRFKK